MPTPYPELNHVLAELVSRVRAILQSQFVGAYLQGSFAVGDFDIHSDVDFIAVIEEQLHSDQVDALQVMHEHIYQLESPWAQHLEGSYFPREILRDHSKQGTELWYLDHGARTLIQSIHCNTILVRWVLREKGVTLTGPPPKSLVDPISPALLRQDIYATITEWGAEILAQPARYNNRFYQTFIVLSYCRMLHDLQAGAAGSKREGAEWAKTNLEPKWSALIDRTWAGRPDPAAKVKLPADTHDFELTLEFVQYVIQKSRDYMKQ